MPRECVPLVPSSDFTGQHAIASVAHNVRLQGSSGSGTLQVMRLALLSCLATLCSTPAFGQLSTPAEWPPVPVTFVDLTYPSAARDAGVSGRVIVHATVDETGHVSSAEALVGPPELAPAAVDNLRQWMFPLTARDVYTVYRFEFTAGRCNDDARSLFRLESPNLAIVTACTRVDRKQPLPWAPFTDVPFDWIRPLAYPPIAQSARIQGVVIVDVRDDGAGRVPPPWGPSL